MQSVQPTNPNGAGAQCSGIIRLLKGSALIMQSYFVSKTHRIRIEKMMRRHVGLMQDKAMESDQTFHEHIPTHYQLSIEYFKHH